MWRARVRVLSVERLGLARGLGGVGGVRGIAEWGDAMDVRVGYAVGGLAERGCVWWVCRVLEGGDPDSVGVRGDGVHRVFREADLHPHQ